MSTPTKPAEAKPEDPTSEDPGQKFERSLKLYDRGLATIKALAIIFGGIWGLLRYLDDQKSAQAAAEQAAKKDFILREKEQQQRQRQLELMIYKEKKEAYYAIIDAACDIVACQTREKAKIRANGFYKLYFGRAHLISELDPEVNDAKKKFMRKLMKYLASNRDEIPMGELQEEVLELTDACQKHIDLKILESQKS